MKFNEDIDKGAGAVIWILGLLSVLSGTGITVLKNLNTSHLNFNISLLPLYEFTIFNIWLLLPVLVIYLLSYFFDFSVLLISFFYMITSILWLNFAGFIGFVECVINSKYSLEEAEVLIIYLALSVVLNTYIWVEFIYHKHQNLALIREGLYHQREKNYLTVAHKSFFGTDRGLKNKLWRKAPVRLDDNTASLSIRCLGTTGSGKTSTALYPFMLQLNRRAKHNLCFLNFKAGLEVKNFLERITEERKDYGRKFNWIGKGGIKFNILETSPNQNTEDREQDVLNILEDIIKASNANNKNGGHFMKLQHSFLTLIIPTLLKCEKDFNFNHLYSFFFDSSYKTKILQTITDKTTKSAIYARLKDPKFSSDMLGLTSLLIKFKKNYQFICGNDFSFYDFFCGEGNLNNNLFLNLPITKLSVDDRILFSQMFFKMWKRLGYEKAKEGNLFHWLFIDESQYLHQNREGAEILSEYVADARAYRNPLCLAHQTATQVHKDFKKILEENIGCLIYLPIGSGSSKELADDLELDKEERQELMYESDMTVWRFVGRLRKPAFIAEPLKQIRN